jgi:hypothetical protein
MREPSTDEGHAPTIVAITSYISGSPLARPSRGRPSGCSPSCGGALRRLRRVTREPT